MSTIPSSSVAQSNTTSAFTAAIVTNAALLAFEVGTFVALKKKLWRIYTPRTYLPPPDKRAPELSSGAWKWLPRLLQLPSEDIIHTNGLDAYMFLRFIRMLIWIFLVFTISLEWVGTNNMVKYYRTAGPTAIRCPQVVTYLLTFFVLFVIRNEMVRFVQLRHQFLLGEAHSRLPQARTVLITTVPDDFANENDLRTFASFVPGGVDKIWLYRDTRTLNGLFQSRAEACQKLEEACSILLAKATNAWRKRAESHRTAVRHGRGEGHDDGEIMQRPPASRELLDNLVPAEKRPKRRTGFLGLFGDKVDSFNWYRDEIARLNLELAEKREHVGKGKFLGSAFIRCNLQMGAHILAQCVSHHKPLKMHEKWMDVNSKDIVWRNLDDGALEMTSRKFVSSATLIGLIVAWAFPVGFIGTLSNLSDLCLKVNWIRWVCKAPATIQGIIQGVLPPALLAIMFALLPFILRLLAWYECIPRYSLISISVYRHFFIFLLVHGFLIVTLSSGITRAIHDIIDNPTHTVQQLANQLPGASIFFLTYMITQGLAGAGSALAQIGPVIFYYVRKLLLGRTPRQTYNATFLMPAPDFGIILPRLSLLATITFAYSVLSPLINFLALTSYVMYYIAFKFLLVYVLDQPDEVETGGLYFPMAVSNLFVGLFEQICLACLFFLKSSAYGTVAVAEGAVMVVLLVMTAFTHAYINKSFEGITAYIPMSLTTKKNEDEPSGARNRETGNFGREALADASGRSINLLTIRLKTSGAIKRIRSETPPSSEEEIARTQRAPSLHGSSIETHPMENGLEAGGADLNKRPAYDDRDNDTHAFDHPSTYAKQAWIWIPKDALNLSQILIQELEENGVSASDEGAFMDERGIVEVTKNPPDEEQ